MELIKAKDKQIAFQNLFNLYVHELSNYDSWLGKAIDQDGFYQVPGGLDAYYDETKKEAYIIMEEQRAVGFVSFSKVENEPIYCVDEIFIIITERKKGIASNTIQDYWKNKSGKLMTHILNSNQLAIQFWVNLFKRNGYEYEITVRDDVASNYIIQL